MIGVDSVLRIAHVVSAVVYLDGGLMLHLSFRRVLPPVPPAQGKRKRMSRQGCSLVL